MGLYKYVLTYGLILETTFPKWYSLHFTVVCFDTAENRDTLIFFKETVH